MVLSQASVTGVLGVPGLRADSPQAAILGRYIARFQQQFSAFSNQLNADVNNILFKGGASQIASNRAAYDQQVLTDVNALASQLNSLLSLSPLAGVSGLTAQVDQTLGGNGPNSLLSELQAIASPTDVTGDSVTTFNNATNAAISQTLQQDITLLKEFASPYNPVRIQAHQPGGLRALLLQANSGTGTSQSSGTVTTQSVSSGIVSAQAFGSGIGQSFGLPGQNSGGTPLNFGTGTFPGFTGQTGGATFFASGGPSNVLRPGLQSLSRGFGIGRGFGLGLGFNPNFSSNASLGTGFNTGAATGFGSNAGIGIGFPTGFGSGFGTNAGIGTGFGSRFGSFFGNNAGFGIGATPAFSFNNSFGNTVGFGPGLLGGFGQGFGSGFGASLFRGGSLGTL